MKSKTTAKPATMAKYLRKLDRKDKLVICNAVKNYINGNPNAHLGMLPFFTIHTVVEALRLAGLTSRRYKQLLAMLSQDLKDRVKFNIFLNKQKVYKRFGAKTELGIQLPGVPKKRVTVGIRWSLPRKQFEPDDDVWVSPTIALTNPRKIAGASSTGLMWTVHCEQRYRAAAERWLIDTCR